MTTVPKPPTLSLALLAAGAVAVVYSLARFWGANPEYLDRFLIVLGASYAAWEARPALRELPSAPIRLGYLPLVIGAVAFPIGWFLQAQVSPKPIVLWWIASAWILAASGVVLQLGGWSHLRRLAFPLGFLLFALPVPNRLLVPLQFYLQSATTAIAAWVLPLLGVDVERQGFILSLPSGDLEVAETCSGVRSVTALTAIAAFVAWWREFRFPRGVVLVMLSIAVIAGVNALRVVLSGLIQEHLGADYIRGNRHEALGVVMVLLGLGCIVGFSHLLNGRANPERQRGGESQNPLADALGSPSSVTLILLCSALATVAGQFLGSDAEQEVLAAAPLDEMSHDLGRWHGTDLPVSDEVTSLLTPDTVSHRAYSDLGFEVHVWVIFWSSRSMVKGYHHPDVCWPNRGFRMSRRDMVPVSVNGKSLPVTVREFSREGKDRQLILYWTQEGGRVWTEADERRVQTTGDSHDWLAERLVRREGKGPTGRFVVLIATPTWGDGTTIRTQTLELAGRVAGELYRVCPWAAIGEP